MCPSIFLIQNILPFILSSLPADLVKNTKLSNSHLLKLLFQHPSHDVSYYEAEEVKHNFLEDVDAFFEYYHMLSAGKGENRIVMAKVRFMMLENWILQDSLDILTLTFFNRMRDLSKLEHEPSLPNFYELLNGVPTMKTKWVIVRH